MKNSIRYRKKMIDKEIKRLKTELLTETDKDNIYWINVWIVRCKMNKSLLRIINKNK